MVVAVPTPSAVTGGIVAVATSWDRDWDLERRAVASFSTCMDPYDAGDNSRKLCDRFCGIKESQDFVLKDFGDCLEMRLRLGLGQ